MSFGMTERRSADFVGSRAAGSTVFFGDIERIRDS